MAGSSRAPSESVDAADMDRFTGFSELVRAVRDHERVGTLQQMLPAGCDPVVVAEMCLAWQETSDESLIANRDSLVADLRGITENLIGSAPKNRAYRAVRTELAKAAVRRDALEEVWSKVPSGSGAREFVAWLLGRDRRQDVSLLDLMDASGVAANMMHRRDMGDAHRLRAIAFQVLIACAETDARPELDDLLDDAPELTDKYARATVRLVRDLNDKLNASNVTWYALQDTSAMRFAREAPPATVVRASDSPKVHDSSQVDFEHVVTAIRDAEPDVVVLHHEPQVCAEISKRLEGLDGLKKLLVYPNGLLEVDRSVTYAVPKDLARTFFGLQTADFVVMGPGLNHARKRWDIAIQAWTAFLANTLSCGNADPPKRPPKLLIGTALHTVQGWDLVAMYRKELAFRGIDEKVGLRHIILIDNPHKLSDFNANVMFNCADVAIFPSVDESHMPTSALELAALGVPSVYPGNEEDSYGMRVPVHEWAYDCASGRKLAVASVEGVASALREVYDDDAVLRRRSQEVARLAAKEGCRNAMFEAVAEWSRDSVACAEPEQVPEPEPEPEPEQVPEPGDGRVDEEADELDEIKELHRRLSALLSRRAAKETR